eukprot:3739603-Ditylum_brightwellii.AAC.1
MQESTPDSKPTLSAQNQEQHKICWPKRYMQKSTPDSHSTFSMPIRYNTIKNKTMSTFQNFDFEHGSTDEPTTSKIPEELFEMMQKMQANMANCIQELKAEQIMPFEEWYSMICNKERQQQHQDHDAAKRIQRIVRGFINCRQQHLVRPQQYQDATTKLQALLQGFLY